MIWINAGHEFPNSVNQYINHISYISLLSFITCKAVTRYFLPRLVSPCISVTLPSAFLSCLMSLDSNDYRFPYWFFFPVCFLRLYQLCIFNVCALFALLKLFQRVYSRCWYDFRVGGGDCEEGRSVRTAFPQDRTQPQQPNIQPSLRKRGIILFS